MTRPADDLDLEIECACDHCDHTENITIHEAGYIAWHNGDLIQDVFSYLTAGQRELMIRSTCSDCWDMMYPDI